MDFTTSEFLILKMLLLVSCGTMGNHRLLHMQYTITENKPVGYRLGRLDEDLLQQQMTNFSSLCNYHNEQRCEGLKFRLRERSNLFELDETSSVLKTKTNIDFEGLCVAHCLAGSLEVRLTLVVNVWLERKLVAVINVDIKVEDTDDNMVVFPTDISRPFELRLKEVIYTKGKTIELPRAIDMDMSPKFSVISYRLDFSPQQWNSLKMFGLTITNDSRPFLVLKEDLDYEDTSEYAFNLIAWNPELQSAQLDISKSSQAATLPIVVKVININDMEPSFTQSLYKVEVYEDTPVGTVVLELKAVDRDVDAVLTYSSVVEPGSMNQSVPFQVESDGRVRLREPVDFEKRAEYDIPVRATDGEFVASARLHVVVLDINDEPPKFTVNPTNISVEENLPPNMLVGQVIVTDADSFAVNSYIECAEPLEDIEKQPLHFSRRVSPPEIGASASDGLQGSRGRVQPAYFDIYTKFTLDREDEETQRVSRLVCWDAADMSFGAYDEPGKEHNRGRTRRLTSTLSVSIHVQDRNDNAPTFTQSVFAAELEENNALREKVIQVTSKDYDTEENAVTHYKIIGNNEDASLFYLDEETGWLYAIARFDRESRDHYSLRVIAFDASESALVSSTISNPSSPSAPVTSTATINIRILDDNDHAPLFQESSELTLTENQNPGSLVGIVTATDLDIGVNGQIVYQLLPDNPQSVFHGSKPARIMGFQMSSNGTLYSTRSFDREAQSRYCLQVQATDQSVTKPLSSTSRICVNILDMNDNAPVVQSIEGPDAKYERRVTTQNSPLPGLNGFGSTTGVYSGDVGDDEGRPFSLTPFDFPLLHISINEAPGYCALHLEASDADEAENAEMKFSIDTRANCSSPSDEPSSPSGLYGEPLEEERTAKRFRVFKETTFRMDERTGKLLLLRRLSREEVGEYCLKLVVEDMGQPPQRTEQLLRLVLEDLSARGDWQGNAREQIGVNTRSSSQLEAKNIVIVIVLSTVSAFLAALLVSAILCMVRPFNKNQHNRHRSAVRSVNVYDHTLNQTPKANSGSKFSYQTSPSLLIQTMGRGQTISPNRDETAPMTLMSGSIDRCSAVDGTWIVGTANLFPTYDPYAPGNSVQDSKESLRLQTADGITPVWSQIQITGTDTNSSTCTYDAEKLAQCGHCQDAFADHKSHFILHPSVTSAVAVGEHSYLPSFSSTLVSQGPLCADMTAVATVTAAGMEEQRSDSGRGASDEEVMFQGPFQPIMHVLPVVRKVACSDHLTDTSARSLLVQNRLPRENMNTDKVLICSENHENSVPNSGIYVCASSIAGPTSQQCQTAYNYSQDSVSTFVHSKRPSGNGLAEDFGQPWVSSLPRIPSCHPSSQAEHSQQESDGNGFNGDGVEMKIVTSMQVNSKSKTRSLPRESLAHGNNELLLEHAAQFQGKRLCGEIDNLFLQNMA
ncbi:hypothetical protein SprV_0100328000 [Sparganum proliferum]